jgi:hypothetical protein
MDIAFYSDVVPAKTTLQKNIKGFILAGMNPTLWPLMG